MARSRTWRLCRLYFKGLDCPAWGWKCAQEEKGRYEIMTSEKRLSVLDAVALYKELTDVESRFRQLKDVLAMRPI